MFLISSAHAVTADVSIAETAKAAEFFLSDGVIVTGSSTNVPADVDELKGMAMFGYCPKILYSKYLTK